MVSHTLLVLIADESASFIAICECILMYKKYWVESYFLIDEREFLVDSFNKEIVDEYYIEGWIELTIDGKSILNRTHWDLVDQLWAYLIDGVLTLKQNGDVWATSFPDQPLEMLITCSQNTFNIKVGENSYSVDSTIFKKAISEGGRRFFTKMLKLVPNSLDVWGNYIEKCEELLQSAAKLKSE